MMDFPSPGSIMTDEKGNKWIVQGWSETDTNCGAPLRWNKEHYEKCGRTETAQEIMVLRQKYMSRHGIFYLKRYETEEDRNLP